MNKGDKLKVIIIIVILSTYSIAATYTILLLEDQKEILLNQLKDCNNGISRFIKG